jgi:hypothetical protein
MAQRPSGRPAGRPVLAVVGKGGQYVCKMAYRTQDKATLHVDMKLHKAKGTRACVN